MPVASMFRSCGHMIRDSIMLNRLFLLCCVDAYILQRWPLSETLAVDDLSVNGASAGPNGTSLCLGLKGSNACHDPDSSCNQCRSIVPHVFHVTWCADTRGYVGITCDLDLGYRSAAGARYGMLQYSLHGRGSASSDFNNASTVVFPDSPYPFSHFAAPSGKNDILTVYQLSMVEGNMDGDNLALTNSSGFCCRATFSGGTTITGTLYIGDLTIRANGLVPPSASPSASAVGGAVFSGAAVGGAMAGGCLLGGMAAIAFLAYKGPGLGMRPRGLFSGYAPVDSRMPVLPTQATSLLSATRVAQLGQAHTMGSGTNARQGGYGG